MATAITSITDGRLGLIGGTAKDAFGMSLRNQSYPEAASQTFKGKKHLVYLNTSGQVVAYVKDGATSATAADAGTVISAPNLLGIAQADASGTTNTLVPVQVFSSQTVLELPVYHSTPASAVTAYAQVGQTSKLYYVRDTTTGCFNYFVSVISTDLVAQGDIATDSNQDVHCQIVGVSPRNAVGTQYGRVFVKFLPLQNSSGNTAYKLVYPFLQG